MGKLFLSLRLHRSSLRLSRGAFRSGGLPNRTLDFRHEESVQQPRLVEIYQVVEASPQSAAHRDARQVSLALDDRWCLHICLLLSSNVPGISGADIVGSYLQVLGPVKG